MELQIDRLRQQGTYIFCGSFFALRGEKPGALWATKEEKYHSAEGRNADRVSPIILT
jgi:hypothetical protein